MALTLIGARLGEVVDKPTQASPPGSFTGTPLKIVAADINIGAQADYTATSGFLGLAALLGVSAIIHAFGVVYAEGGDPRGLVSAWNSTDNALMFFRTGTAVSLPLQEIATTDLTAGDNLRVVAICF